MVLKPDGLVFAPHPVVTEPTATNIASTHHRFLQAAPTDLADYFLAAWEYEHRAALGEAGRDAGEFAADGITEREVSAVVVRP